MRLMNRPCRVLVALTLAALPALGQDARPAGSAAPDLAASTERQLPALTETYKHLHRNPELSHHEEKTSALLAAELRKLGYTVTERVGKYQDGSQAYGVVAVLQNGDGPRVLIRTDMDALPVEEKTGLDYASTVRSTNAQGQDVGVMHACGHDIHMTVLLGVAREMVQRKSQWHGTLMLIGQPSEETIDGARAMLADGLYERFGRPEFVLSEHDDSADAAGACGAERRSAVREFDEHRCNDARNRRPRLGPQNSQGSCADGRGVRGRWRRRIVSSPDRSAAAGCLDRGHHSWRNQEQHHSGRSDDGDYAAHLFRQRSAIRSSPTCAARPMGIAGATAFRRTGCPW